jgi:hypothetical protein
MADCNVDPDYNEEETAAVLLAVKDKNPELVQYIREDLPELAYNDRNHTLITNVHQGQRKLLMAEMEFLNRFYNPDKKTLILYIGAGPGDHIPLLADFYPEADYDLWDPVRFNIAETDTMHIFNDYFTDNSARFYKNWYEDYDELLMISDIRTPKEPGDTFDSFENKVFENMEMQRRWIEIIEPTMVTLKFRIPFNKESIDYLDGEIFIQPWAPIKSAETRIIILFVDSGNHLTESILIMVWINVMIVRRK